MFQTSMGADFGMLVLNLNLRQPCGNSYAIHCPFDDLPYGTVPFPSHMILMDSSSTAEFWFPYHGFGVLSDHSLFFICGRVCFIRVRDLPNGEVNLASLSGLVFPFRPGFVDAGCSLPREWVSGILFSSCLGGSQISAKQSLPLSDIPAPALLLARNYATGSVRLLIHL